MENLENPSATPPQTEPQTPPDVAVPVQAESLPPQAGPQAPPKRKPGRPRKDEVADAAKPTPIPVGVFGGAAQAAAKLTVTPSADMAASLCGMLDAVTELVRVQSRPDLPENALALSDAERAMWGEPAAAVFAKYVGEMTPEVSLVVASLFIAVPRIVVLKGAPA